MHAVSNASLMLNGTGHRRSSAAQISRRGVQDQHQTATAAGPDRRAAIPWSAVSPKPINRPCGQIVCRPRLTHRLATRRHGS